MGNDQVIIGRLIRCNPLTSMLVYLYLFDSRSRTLEVGPNMVNDSPFGALSHWWRVPGSKLEKKTDQT